jgi:hypothetical protein
MDDERISNSCRPALSSEEMVTVLNGRPDMRVKSHPRNDQDE